MCLSLINNWRGYTKERWTHSSSSILQLLFPLKGLCSLRDPTSMSGPVYTDDWFEVSKAYNEDAIAWSCTTMLFVLHETPNNFGDIVSEHFHSRACETLNAVGAYGVAVLLLVGIKRYDRV
ncbi:hypothetical protein RHGRI_012743 [Rhododendron griersonianum]|uniref:Uncharacterized protein n=2 Tax=Rhododendron griersonianum TaxID=479676 RepID=A0AAV6KRU7_9ERIC|nr:hypothetical protein RHGRI_012743 [Rhododendron griersonianum]